MTKCKVNEQKSIVFLYTNNEHSKNKVKKTFILITASKRIKKLINNKSIKFIHWKLQNIGQKIKKDLNKNTSQFYGSEGQYWHSCKHGTVSSTQYSSQALQLAHCVGTHCTLTASCLGVWVWQPSRCCTSAPICSLWVSSQKNMNG